MRIGKAVYVHCWGGVGRTGTVIGCWLLGHRLAEVLARRCDCLLLLTATPHDGNDRSFASLTQDTIKGSGVFDPPFLSNNDSRPL